MFTVFDSDLDVRLTGPRGIEARGRGMIYEIRADGRRGAAIGVALNTAHEDVPPHRCVILRRRDGDLHVAGFADLPIAALMVPKKG